MDYIGPNVSYNNKVKAEEELNKTNPYTQTFATMQLPNKKPIGTYQDILAKFNLSGVFQEPPAAQKVEVPIFQNSVFSPIERLNKDNYKLKSPEKVSDGIPNVNTTLEKKLDLNALNGGDSIWGKGYNALFGEYDKFGNRSMGAIDAMPLFQTGFNIWNGMKANDLAEDALNYQKEMDALNLNNQAALTNFNLTRDENMRRSGAGRGKMTDEEMQMYLNRNGVKGI